VLSLLERGFEHVEAIVAGSTPRIKRRRALTTASMQKGAQR